MGVGDQGNNVSGLIHFVHGLKEAIQVPVIWFRENIVEPNRKPYPYYHQKFRRVPTIDQCYDDDPVCKFEATEQFKRDKKVDNIILQILRDRWSKCVMYQGPDKEVCEPLRTTFREAEEAWFSRYGDMGWHQSAEVAYMKQKHRMIWERRHGKIGSGINPDWKPPKSRAASE